MFKVNNKDTRMTPGAILVSLLLTLKHISHHVLVFLSLTLSSKMPAGKKFITFGDMQLWIIN